MQCRVARYHNIFGPEGTWDGGKEKAPAALCRKVAQARDGGEIEIWGDGKQTRSFLYIDECVKATQMLMRSEFPGPVNIGSEEMVTINQLAAMVDRDRRQAAENPEHSRAGRRQGPQFPQCADPPRCLAGRPTSRSMQGLEKTYALDRRAGGAQARTEHGVRNQPEKRATEHPILRMDTQKRPAGFAVEPRRGAFVLDGA